MPKNTAKDTHKARKPQFPQLELQKISFLKVNSIFFSGKSQSAEKGTFRLETTLLKPKTDRKAGIYPLFK